MRAVIFVQEHQRLARSGRLYYLAKRIPGVVAAFPSLGRYDGVIFVEADDSDRLNDVVVKVSRLPGISRTELHSEHRAAPRR